MTTAFDTTFSFRDFSNDQLLTTGEKVIEILKDLPEQDSHHRQLAIDLAVDVGLLGKILGHDAANEFTLLKGELDDERDTLYAGLAETIRSGRRHPFPAKAQAATRLCAMIERRRPSLHRLSFDENTAELTLLFADFDLASAQSDLTTLDLVSWYDKLQEVNKDYLEAVAEEIQAASEELEDLPSLVFVKQRLSAVLRMCLQGIAYHASWQRAPYTELAEKLEKALSGIRAVSTRRTNRAVKAKSGKAALSS